MDIISRRDAISKGLKRYFTGLPCKHGHIAERVVGGGNCCECRRLRIKSWRESGAKPFKAKESPSQEYLLSRFDYEEVTGHLSWKDRPLSDFKDKRTHKAWHTRYSGKIAGNLHYANGYRDIRLDGKLYKAHRLVWKICKGVEASKALDHINGNKDDNRLANLREVTPQENCRNRQPDGEKLKGVSRVGDMFKGTYCIDDKSYFSECFKTEEEAARWYDEQATVLYKEHASINFKGESKDD